MELDSIMIGMRLHELLNADIDHLNDVVCEAVGAQVEDIDYEMEHVDATGTLYIRAHFYHVDVGEVT